MASYVEIANAAATTVGTAGRLTAPGEDTVLGRAVKAVWDIERQAALREGAWNFAVRRENLAALKDPPKHGFTTRFELPADCMRLLEIYDLDRDRWQLEGTQIHADAVGPLKIRYLADITEPAQFDPSFAKVFSLRIALAIGNKIAGSAFKEELNWSKYRRALADARTVDALENPPIEQYESSWITTRWEGGAGQYAHADYGFGWFQ